MRKHSRIRIPVTHGLKDRYAMDMHVPYESACAGKFTVVAFGRLAAAISVVSTALNMLPSPPGDAIASLEKAVQTLQVIRQRGDEQGIWSITDSEQPIILAGIQHAEACIGILSVAMLEQAADCLLQQLNNEPTPSH